MRPNGNKVLHFYQFYCKYIAQIYTSKVYNVIYISGNTLDKRNTDFQEEEEPGRKETIFFSPLSITALSRYLVISPLASMTRCVESACMHAACMESDSLQFVPWCPQTPKSLDLLNQYWAGLEQSQP